MKQSDFDAALCGNWSKNVKTGFVMNRFLEQNGYPKPATFQDAYNQLVGHGIQRVPTKHFWFHGIGVWLTAAYPDFLKAVTRSNDVTKVVLAWLNYVTPKKPANDYSLREAMRSAKKYQAMRLATTAELTSVRGDLLHTGRVKSPQGKRRAP